MKTKMCTLFAAAMAALSAMSVQAQTIHNDVFWDTVDGTPLYSQGGGIFKFPEPETGRMAYYWYGSHFKEAEQYRQDPSVTLDRQHVVGEKSLCMSDSVDFDREVSQEVRSTPFVSVPDGAYELRLKFRARGKWGRAESGGRDERKSNLFGLEASKEQ